MHDGLRSLPFVIRWSASFAVIVTVLCGMSPRHARAAGKMYWAEGGANTINQANLDGSGRDIIAAGFGDPTDIALDVAAGKLYWTDGTDDLNVARTKSQSLLEPHDIRLRGHQASARASRSSFL